MNELVFLTCKHVQSLLKEEAKIKRKPSWTQILSGKVQCSCILTQIFGGFFYIWVKLEYLVLETHTGGL